MKIRIFYQHYALSLRKSSVAIPFFPSASKRFHETKVFAFACHTILTLQNGTILMLCAKIDKAFFFSVEKEGFKKVVNVSKDRMKNVKAGCDEQKLTNPCYCRHLKVKIIAKKPFQFLKKKTLL